MQISSKLTAASLQRQRSGRLLITAKGYVSNSKHPQDGRQVSRETLELTGVHVAPGGRRRRIGWPCLRPVKMIARGMRAPSSTDTHPLHKIKPKIQNFCALEASNSRFWFWFGLLTFQSAVFSCDHALELAALPVTSREIKSTILQI